MKNDDRMRLWNWLCDHSFEVIQTKQASEELQIDKQVAIRLFRYLKQAGMMERVDYTHWKFTPKQYK